MKCAEEHKHKEVCKEKCRVFADMEGDRRRVWRLQCGVQEQWVEGWQLEQSNKQGHGHRSHSNSSLFWLLYLVEQLFMQFGEMLSLVHNTKRTSIKRHSMNLR